jgi:hypothetical protein
VVRRGRGGGGRGTDGRGGGGGRDIEPKHIIEIFAYLYALMFSIAKLLTLMVCVITPLFHNFSCISGCNSFIL